MHAKSPQPRITGGWGFYKLEANLAFLPTGAYGKLNCDLPDDRRFASGRFG
jgi:hypothetical protein